jgi:CHAT domain-containing protein
MKNSPAALTTTILVSLLVSAMFSSAVGQAKYDKMVVKVNMAYVSGDYIKATKNNAKLKKKVEKKLGKENRYILAYYLMAARNDLANGLLHPFEQNIQQAINISTRVNKEGTPKHAFLLNRIAELLIQNGNVLQALTYVDEANLIVEQFADATDLKAMTELNYAAIYSQQGYYARAIQYIADHENYYSSRAIDKETYIDPASGKLKSRKLSAAEIQKRFDVYAQLLNLKSNTYRFMGKFSSADSSFLSTANWIDEHLSKSDIRYVENQLWLGQMLEENGVDPKISRKTFENALSRLKREHNESHFLALEVYESLLNSYLVNNEMTRFKNLKNEYERVIKKYFSTQSLNYIRLNALEFNAKLDKERTKTIEDKAMQLLASTSKLPEFHTERIKLYNFAYRAALVNQTYSNADRYLQEILKQKEHLFGKETPEYHLTLTETANFYMDFTDKLETAGEIYQNSFMKIAKPQISVGHVSYVRTLNHIARYYELRDEFELASATLEEALIATRTKFDNEDYEYAIELEKIAGLQINIGQFKEASENITEALEVLVGERRDKTNVVFYVKALETQAKLSALKGEFDEAADDIILSQRLLRRAEDLINYDVFASTIGLADVYVKFGRIAKTEELLLAAIDNYESLYGENSRNLVAPLLSYGNLKLFTGEYTEADKIARRALGIAEEHFGERSTKTAYCKKLMAEVYTSIGDYEKAEQNIADALTIQKDILGADHIEVAKSLSQLGLIKFYKGEDPGTIEPLFDESKSIIASKIGNRTPMYADVLKDLSVLYIQESRFDDAFNSLSLAETIMETRLNTKKNVNAASIYMLTGDIYYQQKDYANAETNYNKALKLYERFFSTEHPEYVRILSKLSKVYYMQGDTRKAKKTIQLVIDNYDNFIKVYFPALSEREKAKFWNTIKSDYEFYNTIAMVFKDEDPALIEKVYNNALTTKAILLSSSIKIRQRILNGNDAELKMLYNEWLAKKEFLTTVLSMRVDQLADNEIDPLALSEEVELLEKQLSEKSDIFGKDSEERKVVWEDVQGVLKPNEVAVEMVRFRYFNHIFTDSVIYVGLYVKNSKSQKAPGVFVINNGAELENRYFKVYRNSIKFKVHDRFSYDQYWAPISNAVGSTATIYLSADGVYNQINLEAIPTGDNKYVIDDSNIVMVSNTKDIYFNEINKSTGNNGVNASMFGNPQYYRDSSNSGKIKELPGTEAEIAGLNQLLEQSGWKTKVKLDSFATEKEIKLVNNPRIFHVATHGFFTPAAKVEQGALEDQKSTATENPLLRTGLLLAGAGDLLDETQFNYNIEDGILTAYEAMSMNLDNTDLVVLSACETGLGELAFGEGVYGLQRAFMVAGAQTLIMSMFKVNDEATQKLMINFYSKWLATGKKRQSFIDAKKELRNEFREPIYWGAFIMIGLE